MWPRPWAGELDAKGLGDGRSASVVDVPRGLAGRPEFFLCINLADREMVALNVDGIGMGRLRSPGNLNGLLNHLDLSGTSGVADFDPHPTRGGSSSFPTRSPVRLRPRRLRVDAHRPRERLLRSTTTTRTPTTTSRITTKPLPDGNVDAATIGERPLGLSASQLTAVARWWASRTTVLASILAVGPQATVT